MEIMSVNKAFEKILEKLESTKDIAHDDSVAELVSTRIWNKALYKAKQIVQEVAEKYNDGWIPCGERLPEEIGWYLVCRNDGVVTTGHYFEDRTWREARGCKIIAWQPLPAPYKN